jgi:signal transduction histidine kinase
MLATVYVKQKKSTLANTFFDKSYKLFAQIGSRDNMGICLLAKAENLYDLHSPQSLVLFQQALQIFTELDDKRSMMHCYEFIGSVHYSEGDFDKAIESYRKAISIGAAIGNKRSAATLYTNFSEALFRKGRTTEALQYVQTAISDHRENGRRDQLVKSYILLAEIESALGHHKDAYRYQAMVTELKDSLLNESSAKAMAEMQTKYETGIKDLEIARQDQAIKRKQAQLLLALISIAAVIILSVLLYNRYRLRQKALHDAAMLRQQELRNHAIIEAEEKERIRIARDLHDGVGQQLSAVKMNLSALETEFPAGDIAREDKMRSALALVDEAVKEVRAVSHNMMPNALLRSGLSTAVREFVNRISATDALKVDLQIVGLNDRLEGVTETVLYRVLQECVSNIVKHAQAGRIAIQLIRHDKHLNMLIEDNGRGFDTSRSNDFAGIGLRNIISRVQYLGGQVEFDSTPGRGTTVVVNVPLKN